MPIGTRTIRRLNKGYVCMYVCMYPKLIGSGGFEILRWGPSPSELGVIPPASSGYTLQFLHDCVGLGQAITYIRPVECNMNQDPIKVVLEDCQVCTILSCDYCPWDPMRYLGACAYHIYPCISQPFMTEKSAQKITLDLYTGHRQRPEPSNPRN